MARTAIATLSAAATLTALLGAPGLTDPAAAAATKECRHIQARKERNLCYEEQAKQKPASAARTPMDAQLEQMQRENERVQQRLKGICRGC